MNVFLMQPVFTRYFAHIIVTTTTLQGGITASTERRGNWQLTRWSGSEPRLSARQSMLFLQSQAASAQPAALLALAPSFAWILFFHIFRFPAIVLFVWSQRRPASPRPVAAAAAAAAS